MTVDEALLTLRRKTRDAAAWEVVALDVYQPLLAYVATLLLLFKVAHGETAHDIVHEVLLNFYERWPRSKAEIETSQALHAYLRTSCRNLLVDRYRRERHAEQMVNFLSLKFSSAFQDASDIYKSIFLDEIIRKLPAECAQLFRIYVTEDLSPAEIADRVNASPSTFYSRWYRCLQKAKDIMSGG